MKRPKPNRTLLFVPGGSLFDVFYIDFAGPLLLTSRKTKYILVCIENLTGWSTFKADVCATAEEVRLFMLDKIIPSFGAPKMVLSDNLICFPACLLPDFMERHGTERRTALAYSFSWIVKMERMWETIKRVVSRLVNDTKKKSSKVFE